MTTQNEVNSQPYDYLIVGAGIIGLATALSLQEKHPVKRIAIVEASQDIAQEQTSHNSGVIHAGVYYKPGSLKAELSKKGNKWTKEFCEKYSLPIEYTGKLIVATNPVESHRLEKLHANSIENSLDVSEVLDSRQLSELEPNIKGVSAFLVKDTAITDFYQVSKKISELFLGNGGEIFFNSRVRTVKENLSKDLVTVEALDKGKEIIFFTSKKVIICSGIQSDRIAKNSGVNTFWSMIPFRGEYYELPEGLSDTVKHLIYPVPDPSLPFLGVHLTKMVGGKLTVGPNAVLGFSRDNYRKWSASGKDLKDMLSTKGFWKIMRTQLKTGLGEQYRSLSKKAYLPQVSKYYSGKVEPKDLMDWPAGIRAQAFIKDTGELIEDFLFHKEGDSILYCVNVPSPAATSAKPIGEHIADLIGEDS